ncbi:membrane protein [Infirmifilum uzonense]|uniref:Probable membrane transporter protein n=1 Tax=Infirmifilum uzonense TaxID=1550241 RepID=A0A0F7FIQ0_9CREN|nr:membrane protein [Infirmifilum uzonense]
MLSLTMTQVALTLISGFIVSFSLALIGGGGSLLAIPLLLYFVGLAYDPRYTIDYISHIAIGTTAMAVGLNAYINAFIHWRRGNVRLKEGATFTLLGATGSYLGARVGLAVHGASLIFMLGLAMIAMAFYVLRGSEPDEEKDFSISRTRHSWLRLFLSSTAVGFASGFFGIGGGFLVVPTLLFSTRMDILRAIGTSLIAVGTFGLITAATYLVHAGLVDPLLSTLYLLGGLAGGWIGSKVASSMPRRTLRRIFAVVMIAVALYLIYINYSSVLP